MWRVGSSPPHQRQNSASGVWDADNQWVTSSTGSAKPVVIIPAKQNTRIKFEEAREGEGLIMDDSSASDSSETNDSADEDTDLSVSQSDSEESLSSDDCALAHPVAVFDSLMEPGVRVRKESEAGKRAEDSVNPSKRALVGTGRGRGRGKRGADASGSDEGDVGKGDFRGTLEDGDSGPDVDALQFLTGRKVTHADPPALVREPVVEDGEDFLEGEGLYPALYSPLSRDREQAEKRQGQVESVSGEVMMVPLEAEGSSSPPLGSRIKRAATIGGGRERGRRVDLKAGATTIINCYPIFISPSTHAMYVPPIRLVGVGCDFIAQCTQHVLLPPRADIRCHP